ncbi:NAD(P)-dependent alcohol dehydrogenase [Catellatospora sp. KI3]|uniref:NAD(P)-dependent alcohol dehydrogenase n=1 Tax=Catellatospora sp. KI3 TaxID=3041620 RepID=UPI0024831BBF|nr:NAD(P)-dependent alcohol dehydrogenase [Catellatospora sp. KI3]MDI1461259.1 NAD(P)-dependent alcohol dehydrogenase [Catellatospora sp. KI3]
MRAALYDRYGPPEVLYEGSLPRPAAGPGQVLVRVHATSVNGGELYGRAGRVKAVTGLVGGRGFPKRLGIDLAGEVAALGADVTGLTVGQPVWGVSRAMNTAAEYAAIDANRLAPLPPELTYAQAAALAGVGTTAVTALRDEARLRPGERLLVRGGAGGVGSIVVQLARAEGAHVTALAGASTLDLVRELGAHECVDYRTAAPPDLGRFDVVVDTVGTDLRAWRRLLAPGGRMVAVSFDLDRAASSLGYLAASAVHGPRRVRFFSGNPRRADLDRLAALVARGAVRPVVDRIFPLSQIAAAHRALEDGGVRGKIVVEIQPVRP